MSFMKCIQITEPGKVEIVKREAPVLKKGNAILKLLYGGICGSDLNSYLGNYLYANYPLIPGHEFSAEIIEIEKNDYGLKPGMIVTCNPYFNCGSCYSCERGFVNCCENNRTLGCQWDGAFREYISMPIERIYDGKGLPAKTLALIEPFCISYHGVKRGSVKPGDRVLVVGAGTIGCFAAVAAKMLGAEVYVADIAKPKLDYVERLGVAGTILNENNEFFEEEVKNLTQNKGFDVCIEAVGLPSTFKNCIEAAAFRGRVVVIGVGKAGLDFYFTIIQTKELDIFGSRNALRDDFLELIDYVNAGKVNVESIISAEYQYLNAAQAFSETIKNRDNRLKVILKF